MLKLERANTNTCEIQGCNRKWVTIHEIPGNGGGAAQICKPCSNALALGLTGATQATSDKHGNASVMIDGMDVWVSTSRTIDGVFIQARQSGAIAMGSGVCIVAADKRGILIQKTA